MTEKRFTLVYIDDFEQYLRDNPMSTQTLDNENYYIVECHYAYKRIDGND